MGTGLFSLEEADPPEEPVTKRTPPDAADPGLRGRNTGGGAGMMWSRPSSVLQSVRQIVFDDVCNINLSRVISMLLTEKVTKYCDSLGNWIQTGSTCPPASRHTFTVFNYLPIGRRFQETTMVCSAFRPSNLPVVGGCADGAAHGGNGGKGRRGGASPGKGKDVR